MVQLDAGGSLFNRTITVNPTYDPSKVPTTIIVKQELPPPPTSQSDFKRKPIIEKTTKSASPVAKAKPLPLDVEEPENKTPEEEKEPGNDLSKDEEKPLKKMSKEDKDYF